MSCRFFSAVVMGLGLILLLVPAPVAGQSNSDADAAWSKGRELYDTARYQEAKTAYSQALRLYEQKEGKGGTNVALTLNDLALVHVALGQYTEAEALYRRSMLIYQKNPGKEPSHEAAVLDNLAQLYLTLGQYAKAEPLFQRSLQFYEDKRGKNHTDVAFSLNSLAILYWHMGQYAKAEPLYLRSLQIYEDKLGKNHPDVANSLSNLASLYADMGQYAKAEPLYLRSLQIREDKRDKNHPDVANSLNNLASLYVDMGHYAKAEPLYLRSLQIWEDKLGKKHLDVAASLDNLANLYRDMGQYAKAEPLYQRSLQIRENKLGNKHPVVANSLNNLAALYWHIGQYAEAEPLYLRSLQIREDKLGNKHPVVATSLLNLAALYRAMGQYAKAEPLYLRGLQIYEDKLGKNHPDVANSLNHLATLYQAMGQYAKAEPLYLRGLQIREGKLRKNHPDVADSLNNLGDLLALGQHWRRAAEVLDRVRRVQQSHVQEVLPLLNDREQLRFLRAKDERSLHRALSLGLKNAVDPDLAALSASWVLNGKAVTEEVAAQRVKLLLAAQRSGQATLVKELAAVRQRLAQLVLSPPADVEKLQQQRQQLQQRETGILQQLGKTAAALAPSPWVEVAEVRQVLVNGQVLVEMVRFNYRNFEVRGADQSWLGERYAAWVIPAAGRGDIRIVDLGEVGPIDAAIQAVLDEVQKTPGPKGTLLTKGEPEAEKLLQQPLKKLSDLVLAPLLKHIGNSARWTLSPDSNLWLVPWEMLLLPDGSYAVEKHRIHYVNSGRYLVLKQKAPTTKAGRPRIFADPDYDLEPGQAKKIAQKLKADEELVGELRTASPSLEGILGKIKRLPGTAAEAELIAPTLTRYAGMPAQVYTDQKALKSVFLRLHQPKVLVLCTHGFFLAPQAVDPSSKAQRLDLDGGPRGQARENPLLRCGLLLAGANHFKKAAGEDDGVVTGLDVLNVDLRGTDLVVLSACETGVGDVRNGEGVAGLRQAFQLAGARAVVSSLWNVSDRETALLMNAFFDNLAKGQSKVEALRAAQLARIEKRRVEFGAAHPYFWAAFTLTGMSEAAPAAKATGPVWHTDYSQARQQGKQENKPLAIFVGQGELGYHLVSQEASLAPALLTVLAERYVCLYLDLNGAKARKLMETSGLKGPRGLMLIDRTGAQRLLWHEGTLSNAVLLERLSKAAK